MLPAAPRVMGDADQLQQVCLNLCMNAIQAMPEGGTLDLHLEGLVRRKVGLDKAPPGGYIMLAVADTGVGIAEAHLGRIFEPFARPRPGREQQFPSDSSESAEGGERWRGTTSGSGLGLSVSAGIVKDHDGWIEIERQPSGGTIFRVFCRRWSPMREAVRLTPPARSSLAAAAPAVAAAEVFPRRKLKPRPSSAKKPGDVQATPQAMPPSAGAAPRREAMAQPPKTTPKLPPTPPRRAAARVHCRIPPPLPGRYTGRRPTQENRAAATPS